jgi:hypothetical protein
VQVNPGAFSARYYIASFFPTPFVGPQTLMLMPGLAYPLDDGAEVGASSFVFFVDAGGSVSTTSGAASAAGGTLTLATVVIHVDDLSGTPYSITGYPNLTSSADVVLMPTLQAYIAVSTDVVYFVASTSGLNVSLDGLTVTSGSPCAAAVQSPIKSDGTSVFKANRGVVPVKFTLSVNGAATCQLPAATISLTRTTARPPASSISPTI